MSSLNIGFYIHARIGDSVVALPALYAIKQIFPNAKLYLLTNEIAKNLFSPLKWIDEIILIDHTLIPTINNLKLDYLYSTNSDKNTITYLKTSNAKTILTYLKPYNLFDFRLKCVFRSYRIKKQSAKQDCLDLVNRLNPKQPVILNSLTNAKLQSLPANKEQIQYFLQSCNPHSFPLVMVNPFGFAARENLSLQEYQELISKLLPQFCVILPTFADKKILIDSTFPISILQHPNFAIFHNQQDLLNLVALIEKMHFVISPSTGNIHIADNLQIPSIALFSQKDSIAWGGGKQMHYVLLDRLPREKILPQILQLCYKISSLSQANNP